MDRVPYLLRDRRLRLLVAACAAAVAAAPAPPAPRPVEHALAFFTEATETDAALDGTYAVQAAPPGAPVASATRDAVAVDLGKDAFATAPARRFTRAFTFVVPGTAGDATAIALTKGTNVEATVRPVGQAAAGTAALVAPAGSRVQVDLALDPAVAAMERNARLDTTVKLALAGRVVTVPVTLQKKG